MCLAIKTFNSTIGEDLMNLSNNSSLSSHSQKKNESGIIEDKGRYALNDNKRIYPGYLITYV